MSEAATATVAAYQEEGEEEEQEWEEGEKKQKEINRHTIFAEAVALSCPGDTREGGGGREQISTLWRAVRPAEVEAFTVPS